MRKGTNNKLVGKRNDEDKLCRETITTLQENPNKYSYCFNLDQVNKIISLGNTKGIDIIYIKEDGYYKIKINKEEK